MFLCLGAAFGFTRRAERTGDDFMLWLGVGAILAAAARLNYALYPSLYSDYVYTGDAFTLLFYLVILGASVREIGRYWRDTTSSSRSRSADESPGTSTTASPRSSPTSPAT
jgi:hypothetical protein